MVLKPSYQSPRRDHYPSAVSSGKLREKPRGAALGLVFSFWRRQWLICISGNEGPSLRSNLLVQLSWDLKNKTFALKRDFSICRPQSGDICHGFSPAFNIFVYGKHSRTSFSFYNGKLSQFGLFWWVINSLNQSCFLPAFVFLEALHKYTKVYFYFFFASAILFALFTHFKKIKLPFICFPSPQNCWEFLI